MDYTITSHKEFGICGFASKCHFGSTVAKVAFYHIATESQVNVATSFVDVQIKLSCPNGVNAVFGGVDDHFAKTMKRIRAKQGSDGCVFDFAQTIKINGHVDTVVEATEPVVFILVFDDQSVAINLGCDFLDEVLRAGQLHMNMIVSHKFDINVVINGNHVETSVKAAVFGDGLPVVEELVHLGARCCQQTNEGKQDYDGFSFHDGVDNTYVANGILCRC